MTGLQLLVGATGAPHIHVPAGFMKLLDHPRVTWGYHAEPDPGTARRAILYPRDRVLGGAGSIHCCDDRFTESVRSVSLAPRT